MRVKMREKVFWTMVQNASMGDGRKMIKLVVSDLDGTLLQKGEERLSERTLLAIQRLMERGVLFAAASGRTYSDLRRLFGAAGDQMAFICSDGALTMYKGKVLEERPVARARARGLYDAVMGHSRYSLLFSGRSASYIQPRSPGFEQAVRQALKGHALTVGDLQEVPEPILKFALYADQPIEDCDLMVQKAESLGLRPIYAEGKWREYVAPGVHKGAALAALRQRFGFSKDECMAFGDNLNDLEMMEQVGFDYAMAQGKAALKAVCGYQTGDVVKTLNDVFGLEL